MSYIFGKTFWQDENIILYIGLILRAVVKRCHAASEKQETVQIALTSECAGIIYTSPYNHSCAQAESSLKHCQHPTIKQ